MKIRDSCMPDRETWERFFEPSHLLRKLALSTSSEDVADFGCGYGTFSIAAALLTSGIVYAFDIDGSMIEATAAKARHSAYRT